MILIADSGATKTTWVLLDAHKNQVGEYSTMGFSPIFHTEKDIVTALNHSSELTEVALQIQELRYFGAGCSSEERNARIMNATQRVFPNARIFVEHDLLGAAIATCGNAAGIACILGTGSNSCFFDGQKVHEVVPSLDFILSDEGSGTRLGIELLRQFMYKRLPQNIHDAFNATYHVDKEIILRKVYSEPHPKGFLSSFAKFLYEHKIDASIRALIAKCFDDFFEYRVKCYANYDQYPTHFVGSIAHYFSDILEECAEQQGVVMGKVIQAPIHGLVDFFRQERVE